MNVICYTCDFPQKISALNVKELVQNEVVFSECVAINPTQIDILHVQCNVLYMNEAQKQIWKNSLLPASKM